MKLNKEALNRLLYDKFDGNYSRLARELQLNVTYVYRVLEKDKNCGAKFFSSVIKWCNDNGMDYNEYIFLLQSFTAVNTTVFINNEKP